MSNFEETILDMGLSFDDDLDLAVGLKNGYYLAIQSQQKNIFTLLIALSQDKQLPDQEALKAFVKDSSYFTGVAVKDIV